MKIVIISQHIFPIQTPRAHRTTELIKELSRQGHDVSVFCVLGKHDYSTFCKEFNIHLYNIPVHFQRIPYTSDGVGKRALVDKILGRLFGKVLEFPTIEFIFTIPRLIRDFEFENSMLLISIADPHHIHWGCAIAKKKYPKKFPRVWIADCSDPFMNNNKTTDHLRIYGRFEKMFCRLCSYITVPHSRAFEGYYAEFRHKIHVIPQGFNFQIGSKKAALTPQNQVVTFAYAGVFLKDIRNPTKFLECLSNISIDFKFIIYTPYPDLVIPFKALLGNKMEIRQPIERTELLKVLQSMDFLLNLENVDTPTALPSKLIDYAIVNRPILSINPDNVNQEKLLQFIKKDYRNSLEIDNLEQYHITAVTNAFLKLAKQESV